MAIPLALLLSRRPRAARSLLYIASLVQTIPSLALLALLIPLVGLGKLPAILTLFLYSLLPIVRNTLTGLFSIDPLYRQVAQGIGLSPRARATAGSCLGAKKWDCLPPKTPPPCRRAAR